MNYLANVKAIVFFVIIFGIMGNNTSVAQIVKINFSTLLGKADMNDGHCIAVDKHGYIYICGTTDDKDFPVTSGAFDTSYNGNSDAFITKLTPDGKHIVYSTFIGGSGREHHCGIAVDENGNVYMVGGTFSHDFPVTKNAFDTTYNGGGDWGGDIYVLKLNSSGSKLLYATYIGGNSNDTGFNIAIDSCGYAYIQGTTTSTNFPVSENAFSRSLKGEQDAFVAKIDTNGNRLIYADYIGGDGMEVGQSIIVDKEGNAYITGATNSNNFPSKLNNHTLKGDYDAFIIKVNATGSDFIFSNLIGGTGYDIAMDITADVSGDIYMTGTTQSNNFPCTINAMNTTYKGKGKLWWGDVFITKINHNSGLINYSAVYGGTGSDIGVGITCTKNNMIVVSGNTDSRDFPITSDALYGNNNGSTDVFISMFDPNVNTMIYSSYYGGKNSDETWGRLISSIFDNLYLIGYTSSPDFPISPDALDSSYNGAESYFIMKLKICSLTHLDKK